MLVVVIHAVHGARAPRTPAHEFSSLFLDISLITSAEPELAC